MEIVLKPEEVVARQIAIFIPDEETEWIEF